jgi:hypothetical protein
VQKYQGNMENQIFVDTEVRGRIKLGYWLFRENNGKKKLNEFQILQ